MGVAIVLSRQARKAWEIAGSGVLYFGLRIIAIRLHIIDPKGKVVKLFLVSAYAPVGAAPQEERTEYQEQFQECIDACAKDEVLVIGTDANASAGVRAKHDDPFAVGRDQVRGPFGETHENNAGRELCSMLGANELCLPTTHFRHKRYATWQNPCSRLWHQLDHWIVRQRDLKRISNAVVMGLPGKESDHTAVSISLRIGRSLKKRRVKGLQSPKRMDHALLKVPETASRFRDHVVQEMAKHSGTDSDLQQLQDAMKSAAEATLASTERKQPGWFEAAKSQIEPVIMARNAAQAMYNETNTQEIKARLKTARKHVKRAVTAA